MLAPGRQWQEFWWSILNTVVDGIDILYFSCFQTFFKVEIFLDFCERRLILTLKIISCFHLRTIFNWKISISNLAKQKWWFWVFHRKTFKLLSISLPLTKKSRSCHIVINGNIHDTNIKWLNNYSCFVMFIYIIFVAAWLSIYFIKNDQKNLSLLYQDNKNSSYTIVHFQSRPLRIKSCERWWMILMHFLCSLCLLFLFFPFLLFSFIATAYVHVQRAYL